MSEPAIQQMPQTLTFGDESVSALADAPADPKIALALAHGAGAGMDHAFMRALAEGFAQRGVATLRYQFPYMQKGSRRPDPPALAHRAVQAAVQAAALRWPGAKLYAGGKSFGARMSSQAQAHGLLPEVAGLVFVGFPLHPAGKPAATRAEHLARVTCPMLFLQGSRDTLAQLDLLTPVVQELGEAATLRVFEDADHSFHVLKRSGKTDRQVLDELLDAAVQWLQSA